MSDTARREPPARASVDRGPPAKRLFFDLLPENPNDNIARHLSAHTNFEAWTRFVSDDDIATMFDMRVFNLDSMFNSLVVTSRKYEVPVISRERTGNWIIVESVDAAYRILI